MAEEKQYQKEYREFLDNYKSGIITGERVGELIARLAQYFTEANLEYATSLINFNIKASEVEDSVDDNNKPISSAKAKVKASATMESQKLIQDKVVIENIEQMLNSLKALQRSILQEFSQSGLS